MFLCVRAHARVLDVCAACTLTAPELSRGSVLAMIPHQRRVMDGARAHTEEFLSVRACASAAHLLGISDHAVRRAQVHWEQVSLRPHALGLPRVRGGQLGHLHVAGRALGPHL